MTPTAEVLITDGLHVPVIGGTSFEIRGRFGGIEFRQKGPIVDIKACTGLLIMRIKS